MARLPHHALVAVGVVVVATLAVGAVVLRAGHGTAPLAGAELLADAEGPVGPDRRSVEHAGPAVTLGDIRLDEARVLSAGGDDFAVFIQAPFQPGFVRATVTGHIRAAEMFPFRGHTGALDMAPDGRYAMTDRTTVTEVAGDWLGDPDHYLEARWPVGAVDVDTDGLLLVGGAAGPTIDWLALDGTTRRLLAPAGQAAAEVVADERLGPIVALHRLPDQRVVFVSDTAGGFRLYVIDDGRVRRVEGAGERNPVRFAGGAPIGRDGTAGGVYEVWPHFPAMTPVAPGPGGNVITIGLGRGDVPEISLVDVDTGEIDVLARLDGVEPNDAEPVSAVAVGDDLVFTASGCVWRLEGALGRLNQG
jgi:hypothetical protein